MDVLIHEEPPVADDIVVVLRAHLHYARDSSPPGHVHALDLDGLQADDITFCTARRDGELVGVGALRDLGGRRAEIKSMHTVSTARGQGIGRLMLDHLTALARRRGATWLGLETGTMDQFAPARRLYEVAGFTQCPPWGEYTVNEHSVCMAKMLP